MVSYYWVDGENTTNGVKYFTIYNMADRRTVSEPDLARAITEHRVVLLNYQLASTGSGRIVRLRTNQIIPEEKVFQTGIFNKLMDSYIAGKAVVSDHLELANGLFNRTRDAATNKFLTRVLEAVNLYMSYMRDVKVTVVIRGEKDTVRLARDVDYICNANRLNIIDNLSNTAGMQIQLAKFKTNYKKDFKTYSFLVDLLIELVDKNVNGTDISQVITVLHGIINKSTYTFVGEQMDKQFCVDLLELYKKSVYDNIQPNLHKLTDAERQQKAEECCMTFRKAYENYNKKIKDNRKNIMNSIRNGGADAIQLLDTLKKLDSTDYTLLDKWSNSNSNQSDYEKYLLEKDAETKILIRKIEQSLKSKTSAKAVKAISTAIDVGADSMLNSQSTTAIGIGAVAKCVMHGKETFKLADELTDYSINSNFPDEVASIIKTLKSCNDFYAHMVMYIYEKLLYNKIVQDAEHKYKRTVGRITLSQYFKYIPDEFKMRSIELEVRLSNHVVATFKNSYINMMMDLLTIDDKDILHKIFNMQNRDDVLMSGIRVNSMLQLEKAWIPAYKIMCMDIDTDKVYSKIVEDAVFWKVLEDLYVVKGLDRCDETRNEKMDKYVATLNNAYNARFLRSKDVNIDVLKLVL